MNFDTLIRENLLNPASAEVLHQLAEARSVEDREGFDSILLGILSCVVPPAVWSEAISRAKARHEEWIQARSPRIEEQT